MLSIFKKSITKINLINLKSKISIKRATKTNNKLNKQKFNIKKYVIFLFLFLILSIYLNYFLRKNGLPNFLYSIGLIPSNKKSLPIKKESNSQNNLFLNLCSGDIKIIDFQEGEIIKKNNEWIYRNKKNKQQKHLSNINTILSHLCSLKVKILNKTLNKNDNIDIDINIDINNETKSNTNLKTKINNFKLKNEYYLKIIYKNQKLSKIIKYDDDLFFMDDFLFKSKNLPKIMHMLKQNK